MSDLIPNNSAEVTTLTSNSVTTVNVILNTPIDVTLPATLANCMLNLQFLLDGEYVTDAITGSMTVQGKYKNGRTQDLSTIDLSSVDEYLVIGKFTKLIVTVTSLSGADTVVVSADQNANITAVSNNGGSGSGATSLVISSPNNTVSQTSQSYNATTQTLSLGLQASIPQSTFFPQAGTSQTVVALLAAQIPPITDKVGNLYIVTNTSTDYINLTKTLTGSFLGYGGFANCSSTDLVIPPLGVGIFATLSVGAGNANTYQITGVSNNSNISELSIFAGGNLASIFTTANVIDKVQNIYQIENTNSDAITITSSFTNYNSWANCTATTMQIPGNGSALILTSVANSSYSILLTSAGLSLPTTPSFNTVTITESSNSLAIGPSDSQSIFSSNATANQTVTLPNAPSVTVQPSTVATGDYVTGIDENGALVFETLPVTPSVSSPLTVLNNSADTVDIINNGSRYIQINNALIFATVIVTYPDTTGLTSNAALLLEELPFAILENTFTIFTTAPTITYIGTISATSNVISIYDKTTGTAVTNEQLSGQNLVISQIEYLIDGSGTGNIGYVPGNGATYIINAASTQSIIALLAAQTPPITDAVGNWYIVNNTSDSAIILSKTGSGSIAGSSPYANSSATQIAIPARGCALFFTTSVNEGNQNTYQIALVSYYFNVNNGVAGLDSTGLLLNSVLPTGIDTSKLADGSVSNTEFQYLSGATSNIQDQINAIVPGSYTAGSNINISGNVISVTRVAPVINTTSTALIMALGLGISPQILYVNASELTIGIPNATLATSGIEYIIKTTSGVTNTVLLPSIGGQTIDGNANLSLPNANSCATIISDGTNWFIKSLYIGS